MTDLELNVAIQEALGLCKHWATGHSYQLDGTWLYTCCLCGKEFGRALPGTFVGLPDYCSSRDLCARVMNKMGDSRSTIFLTCLWELIEKSGTGGFKPDHQLSTWKFLTAHPRMWAQALLLTLTAKIEVSGA